MKTPRLLEVYKRELIKEAPAAAPPPAITPPAPTAQVAKATTGVATPESLAAAFTQLNPNQLKMFEKMHPHSAIVSIMQSSADKKEVAQVVLELMKDPQLPNLKKAVDDILKNAH